MPTPHHLPTGHPSGIVRHSEKKTAHQATATDATADAAANSDLARLPAEGGSYFSDFHPQPSSKRVRTPSALNALAAGISGSHSHRLFEKLRQVALQQNIQSFPQLPARTQALARLGGLLVMYREDFIHQHYHFFVGNEVIAVLDRAKGKFLIKSPMPVLDYSNITTRETPGVSRLPTEGFERMNVKDAVWLYARHDPQALLDLPAHLGTGLLQLHKLPKVSEKLMTDADLSLIRKLLKYPRRFDDVLEKNQLGTQLSQIRSLTCFELVPKKWTLRNEFYNLFFGAIQCQEVREGNTPRRPRKTRSGKSSRLGCHWHK